ncbi:MAG: hypothetical protein N3A57_06330 [Negativicutes bacterium]|nr:hypothetical protein [Negativicutes bacterium]
MVNGNWLWWLAVAVLAVIVVMRRRALWKLVVNDASDSMERLQRELQTTGDSVIKRMEDLSAHLELLLAEADSKIAAMDTQINIMNRLLIQSEINGGLLQGSAGELRGKDGTGLQGGYSTAAIMSSYREQMAAQQLHRQPLPASGAADDAPSAAEVFGFVAGDESARLVVGEEQAEDSSRARTIRVVDMLRQGYEVDEIARLLAMGRGEVMLIRNLNLGKL